MTDKLLADAPDVSWSVMIRSGDGMPLTSVGADAPLRTASVGKVLLLLETARAIVTRQIDPRGPLRRLPEEWVRDSGIWHTLIVDKLPADDVASLVGAVSDNLATNILLRRVGLPAVAATARTLGLRETALHDHVRELRAPGDPMTLSTGTAAELSDLMLRVLGGAALGDPADGHVREWLSGNVDQSMVGRAFVERMGLDPIAHHAGLELEPLLVNKTGTDDGVRADVGAARYEGATIAWAAIANWDACLAPPASARIVGRVLDGMREIGDAVVTHLVDAASHLSPSARRWRDSDAPAARSSRNAETPQPARSPRSARDNDAR